MPLPRGSSRRMCSRSCITSFESAATLRLLHRLADDRKGLRRSLVVRNEEVGTVEIERIDVAPRREFGDLHHMRAFEGQLVDILGLDDDAPALRDLVASGLLIGGHLLSRLLVHHVHLEPMAGLAVELVEVDPGGLRRGWIESDGAIDQRQAKVAFPHRVPCHVALSRPSPVRTHGTAKGSGSVEWSVRDRVDRSGAGDSESSLSREKTSPKSRIAPSRSSDWRNETCDPQGLRSSRLPEIPHVGPIPTEPSRCSWVFCSGCGSSS